MIDTLLITSYVISVAILVIVPGVDTIIFMKALVSGGRTQALILSLGVISGCACWGGIIIFGIGDYIYSSDKIYNTIRILGATYLIYLSVKSWQEPTARSIVTTEEINNNYTGWFFKGVISNILNPKVGLFYIAIIPSFISSNPTSKYQTITMIILHILIYSLWTIILLTMSRRLTSILDASTTKKIFNRAISVLFVTLSMNILFSE